MFEQVLQFWFDETAPAQWWRKDADFDRRVAARFAALHGAAVHCELFEWRRSARGRLAEVIVLDQFSRNMFRDSAQAFASDSLALALAQECIATGCDEQLQPIERSVLYLPFMHSESAKIHEIAVELYRNNGLAENYDYELRHKRIIDRFGRFPHRNAVLGRTSTAEELEFLQQPGSSF